MNEIENKIETWRDLLDELNRMELHQLEQKIQVLELAPDVLGTYTRKFKTNLMVRQKAETVDECITTVDLEKPYLEVSK